MILFPKMAACDMLSVQEPPKFSDLTDPLLVIPGKTATL
jgi:hypothetical protein